MLRVVNVFSKLTDANLEVSANSILQALTGNPNFPNPVPDLQTLKQNIEEFSLSLALAAGGGKAEVSRKNEKRKQLLDALVNLGNYVVFVSSNDRFKAESSGFTFAKAPTSRPILEKPANLELRDGQNLGELRLDFDSVAGAKSYIYQCAPDPITENTVWESKAGTVCHAVFSNLTSGKKYWCRAAAIGVKEQTVYSDLVGRIVQ